MYAETNPAKVTVVVDNYGPTDATDPKMSMTLSPCWNIVAGASKLPPTLIQHNEKDMIVDMHKHSDPLIAALRKTKVDSKFIPYDDSDEALGFHPFLPGSKADRDSKDETIKWLAKHI